MFFVSGMRGAMFGTGGVGGSQRGTAGRRVRGVLGGRRWDEMRLTKNVDN